MTPEGSGESAHVLEEATMHHGLVAIAAAVAAASLLMTLLLHVVAHLMMRRGRNEPGPTPPVSVLKPLRGLDEGLEQNLRSLAEQDYPAFEILFAAEDPGDPALQVARRIQQEHPHVPMRVLTSEGGDALNPKVRNLIAMTRVARHDVLLVSDSNVRPGTGYLRAIASELRDPRVGLVSSILVGTGEQTAGALLENAHLNSFILAAVCAGAGVARHPCVIGKSMLLRRSDLGRLGGWESVRDILAEDYVLGHRFKAAGFRVALSSHPVPTLNVRWTIRRFLARHLRWNQMRRRIAPTAYAFEPLLYPVPWLVLVLLLAMVGHDGWMLPSRDLAVLALLGIAVKAVSDQVLSLRLRGNGFGWLALAWMPVKDVLALGLWLLGGVVRTVSWRGHRMRIGAGSRLEGHAPEPVLGVAGATE